MKKEIKRFQISWKVIWASSIILSILASIPKYFEPGSKMTDVLINSSITMFFSLFIWYYNIYAVPIFTQRSKNKSFLTGRPFLSLIIGMITMLLIVIAHQELFMVVSFTTRIMFEVLGVLINVIVYMFIHLMYQNYRTQQIGTELEKTISVNLGAQYELLKQQVNPHFLFNSLNTLKSMVEMQDTHSVDFILKLSDFYRFTLESRKLDLIPLHEELQILESYTYLLKARFEAGFIIKIDIDPQYNQSLIPPFTLQLLIENCIKHNVVSLRRPLHIRLYTENDFVVVENKIQLKNGVVSTGVGLDNINQRVMHLVEKEIEIIKDENIFKVKIPMIHDYTNN